MANTGKDEALLKEIRDRYTALTDLWRDLREERQKDIRYLCGDVWSDEDKNARKEAGRPCINHDQLNQYVNQAVNSARQNRRGIKVEPRGNGANDKTAEFRQQLIRGIEYESKAQSIYLRAYQDMVEGSYGFARIGRKYSNNDLEALDPSIFDQEITIGAILNPDSVLFGYDTCKMPDWSDARDCFVLDPMPKEDFLRQYPDAEIRDFESDHFEVARDWLQDNQVLVAEYWRIETDWIPVYLLRDGTVKLEIAKGEKYSRMRKVEKKTLVQYMTNGVEILDRVEQPGDTLAIVPFIGLARYLDEGGGPKLKLFSLVRLARDPQMSLAYLASQEMEEAGLSPKTPYVGYTGQFESDWENWKVATKQPFAFLQIDPVTDSANGETLPLPQRQQFTPNFQAYEIAKDATARAIQAAMGISPLPTAAQRNNEKSGVALDRIASQEAIGSYHFIDGYDRALELAGRVIDAWIRPTYDTERDAALRKPDDTHRVARINTEAPQVDPETGQTYHYQVDQMGDHNLTVSTGPSYDSQRQDAADFLDQLVGNLETLPVAPPQAAKILALAIRMRELGPKGDEMAEIISPSTPDQAAQLGQQLGQQQQQMQQAQEIIAKLQAELQQLKLERAGKVIDNEARISIERMKIEADVAKAEIATKAQQLSERMQYVEDLWQQLHGQAHEAAMQSADQAHERGMAAQQHQQATELAAQQQQQQPLPQAA